MHELEEHRRAKDEFFAAGEGSPLTKQQRKHFNGLAYYEHDPSLVIDAVLDTGVDPEPVELDTTGGRPSTYHRAGVVRFELGGEAAQVTLFRSAGSDELFVPFRDATSGDETYGAGRYLDVDPPSNGRVVVDFNYAYNPYCAYNDAWTCPLPPLENWLRVPIRAGEKALGQPQGA